MAKITINDLEFNREMDREAMRELRGKGLNTVKRKIQTYRNLLSRTSKWLHDTNRVIISNF